MSNPSESSDSRELDIFRYVADEMSIEEEQRFETELEHDQTLREQVAEMVCTMATVDNVFAESKVSLASSSKGKPVRIGRIVASIAALALIATLAITLIPGQTASDSDADSIAIAWAESVGNEEFELPEDFDDNEFASIDFESDDDWLIEVVNATNEDTANLN